MKILVCTDGSEHSQKALRQAAKIAASIEGARVSILYVYESLPAKIYGNGSVPVYIHEKYRESSEEEGKQILAEAAKVFEAEKITPEIILKEGHPANTITKISEEQNFDMVVVGSRGLGGFKKVLLGSVSNAVVQEAKTSVLVVK